MYNYNSPYGYGYGVNNQNYNIPNQYYGNMMPANDMGIQGVRFATRDEAKAYRLEPNQRVMLMDKDNSIFYIKSADALGQSTLETYEFKKVNPEAIVNNQNSEPKFDMENLVKKDDLNNLVTLDKLGEELKVIRIDLSQKIDDLKKSINIKKYLEGEIKDV